MSVSATFWVRAGAALMALAVAFGAFGAHALKNVLTDELRAIYDTAVRYHAWHALGLFAVAWLADRHPSRLVNAAGWLFLAGIWFFSGSLYALSLTGIRKFGAITPIGGLAFIVGWVCLALAPLTSSR